MPAKSAAQQRFFGAELARKRAGKETTTDMTEGQIKDFASTPRKNLPEHVQTAQRPLTIADRAKIKAKQRRGSKT